jgi:DNA-binding NtrC family response regulator
MMTAASLLLADDDPVALALLAEVLAREGYRVQSAGGGAECLALAERDSFDVAIVDLRMPDLDGLQVVRRLAAIQPGISVVILTAFATIDSAIEAIREGASDYLSKPFRMEQIKIVVRRILEARRLAQQNLHYRQALQDRFGVQNLVGQSGAMVEVYKLVARVASVDTTVLVQGETGTGKELVARAIHYASPRADAPFVVVDCTAVPEALFESELFGHERGAFTGAFLARRGLFETAAGGTCFLDEIGELSAPLQAKLLRTLQDQAVRRVGGNDWIPVDVRVIAATNRDLRKRVEEGRFREDLYYRLNVVAINVPPLRERPEDLSLLAQHFVEKYAHAAHKPTRGLTPDALALLTAYHWPGNVRELENAIERAVALSSSELLMPDDLPPQPRQETPPTVLPSVAMTLEEVKRWYVSRVLADVGGNKVQAAERLGIDRATLYRMLRRRAGGEDLGE